MVARRRGQVPEVVRITTAPESPETEMAHRQKRYMVSMGFRTACFVAAILVGGGWLRWVLFSAALLLPTIAVVMANSASPRIEGTTLRDPGRTRPELGPGPSPES